MACPSDHTQSFGARKQCVKCCEQQSHQIVTPVFRLTLGISWVIYDEPWWGVHTLYQFTTKVTYSFFLHSVTVPGILRIDSLTFQTSVFILHLPEKQLCGSSPIHFFFFFLHNLHRLVVSLLKTVQFCRFSLSELAGEVFLGLCVWTSHSLPRHACFFFFCGILILSHRQTNCRFG